MHHPEDVHRLAMLLGFGCNFYIAAQKTKLYRIFQEKAASFKEYLDSGSKKSPAKVLPVKVGVPTHIKAKTFFLPAQGKQG